MRHRRGHCAAVLAAGLALGCVAPAPAPPERSELRVLPGFGGEADSLVALAGSLLEVAGGAWRLGGRKVGLGLAEEPAFLRGVEGGVQGGGTRGLRG